MRKRIQVVIIALCAVVMLSLIGYLILHFIHDATGNYPEPVQIENADRIYKNAVSKARSQNDLDFNVNVIQHTTANNQVFVEQVEQYITYHNMHSDQMVATVEEIRTIGSHSFIAFEAFADDIIYVDIENSCFRAATNANAFRSRYAPPVLLTAELYDKIIGYDTGSSYVIMFGSPIGAEDWIPSGSVNLTETWGIAYVSYSGKLEKSTYYICHEENGTIIRRAITTDLKLSSTEIELPVEISEYVPISYIDGPKELEIACGYLLSAPRISAQTNDTIFFEAYGDKRLQQININVSSENGFSARVDTVRTLENTSHTGEISTYKQTQLFENGIYQVSENGGNLTTDELINQDSMRSYYQNLLVSTIMLPKFITNSEQVEKNGIRTITFTTDDAFTEQMISNACQTLYQKPDLMDTLESSHKLDNLTAYIQIDTATGIPLSSGISYSGTHNINNFDYKLQYSIDQTYSTTG